MAAATEKIAVRAAQEGDVEALASLSAQLGYPTPVDEMRERYSRVRASRAGEIFVAVTVRSAGVGAALLAAAEDWARAQGFATMRVRSNVIRERAHRFYEREGYMRIKAQAMFRKILK